MQNNKTINKIKIIIFVIICAICAISLPFSNFFENKINNILNKDMSNYAIAIEQDLVVHILDVGSADCIVIELPDGKKGLIDAGVDIHSNTKQYKEYVIEYIQTEIFNSTTGTFDFFILTHSDSDHCNNAVDIFNTFQINKVYRPTIFYDNSKNASMSDAELQRAKDAGFLNKTAVENNVTAVVNTNVYYNFLTSVYNEPNCEVAYASDDIVISNNTIGYEMKFYSPYKLKYSNVNSYSPIIILSYKNHKIALTGDAQSDVENYVTTRYDLPKVDVLKVAHHGSETSSTQDFLNELNPTYAFISVGLEDTNANPDAEVLERIKTSGVLENNILQTANDGDLIFAVSDSGEMFIASSNGVTATKIKWYYVCGGIVIVSGVALFAQKSKIKNIKKRKNR